MPDPAHSEIAVRTRLPGAIVKSHSTSPSNATVTNEFVVLNPDSTRTIHGVPEEGSENEPPFDVGQRGERSAMYDDTGRNTFEARDHPRSNSPMQSATRAFLARRQLTQGMQEIGRHAACLQSTFEATGSTFGCRSAPVSSTVDCAAWNTRSAPSSFVRNLPGPRHHLLPSFAAHSLQGGSSMRRPNSPSSNGSDREFRRMWRRSRILGKMQKEPIQRAALAGDSVRNACNARLK